MTKISLDKTIEVIGTGKSYLLKGRKYEVHPTVAERLIEKGAAEKATVKTEK